MPDIYTLSFQVRGVNPGPAVKKIVGSDGTVNVVGECDVKTVTISNISGESKVMLIQQRLGANGIKATKRRQAKAA